MHVTSVDGRLSPHRHSLPEDISHAVPENEVVRTLTHAADPTPNPRDPVLGAVVSLLHTVPTVPISLRTVMWLQYSGHTHRTFRTFVFLVEVKFRA